MSRKNCRMTEDERATHDRAVRLRKMTDQQLREYMDAQHTRGMDDGLKLAECEAKHKKDEAEMVTRFIDWLDEQKGSGNGIGGGTIYRLRKAATAAQEAGVIGGEP